MELKYRSEQPDETKLLEFYNRMGWNDFLKLDLHGIRRLIEGSYYMVSVYANETLIGNARIISDGVANAYLCGLGVLKPYRKQGVAAQLIQLLKEKLDADGLLGQFFCEENLRDYYEKRGAVPFAIGMKI